MGSKGQTTTRQQDSTYTGNPVVTAAGTQALGAATNYANSPFQVPTAPVAGFSGDQNQAFQQIRDSQGMAQPYFDTASMYANQSASPISAGETANYLNPYASYALAGLADTQGAQNTQMKGNLIQGAGGTGADRIGVAQGEKFRQDQLARGNLMGGFYQQALGAAQQDRGRQGAAASLFGSFGPAAQNASLQGTGALLNTGGLQQQQEQAQLNAPYQNLLAQIQDPAQKAQFLASITGGLAPAFGGNTNSQGSETRPGPSAFSQIAGLGATALGAYMSGGTSLMAGGLGGASGKGSGGGSIGEPSAMVGSAGPGGSTWQANPWGGYSPTYSARGGRVNPYAMGGSVYEPFQHMADGGMPAEGGMFGGMGFKPLGWDDGAYDPPPAETSQLPPEITGQPPSLPDTAMSYTDAADEGADPVPRSRPGMPPAPFVPSEPPPEAAPEDTSSRLARNPWMALAYAGAKTAAGTSPFAGVNIGAGAAAGIEHLDKQQTAGLQAKRVDLEAKRLYQQMQHQRDTLGETKRLHDETIRHNKTAEERLAEEAARRRATPVGLGTDPDTMLETKGIPDPKNPGKYIKIDPRTGAPMADSAIPPLAKPTAGAEPGAEPAPVPAKDVMGWTPDAIDAAAQQRLQSGQFPSGLGTNKQAQVVRAAIAKRSAEMAKEAGIEPADLPKKWQQFKSEQIGIQRFTSGKQGDTVRSLGVVVDHVATAKNLALALKNGNVQAFNTLANKIAEQTGKPAPTNLDAAMKIVGPEIIKALGVAGAGTQTERAEAGKIISIARSPEQILGAVDRVVQPLLGGQLRGLRSQFKVSTGLGDEAFHRMIGPEALQFLERKEPAAEPPPPKKTTKPAASKPKAEPADRFNELIKEGKTKAEAYSTMRGEGYQ